MIQSGAISESETTLFDALWPALLMTVAMNLLMLVMLMCNSLNACQQLMVVCSTCILEPENPLLFLGTLHNSPLPRSPIIYRIA